MLNRIGLEAYPVLLNAAGGVIEYLSSLTQFDYATAAYKRTGYIAWRYIDGSADLAPFGGLPYTRLARYCARTPIPPERRTLDPSAKAVN